MSQRGHDATVRGGREAELAPRSRITWPRSCGTIRPLRADRAQPGRRLRPGAGRGRGGRQRRCRRSTTRPWTATRCGSRTSPPPPRRTRSRCRWWPRSRRATPGRTRCRRAPHPDHDRRDAAARDRGRRAGGVDRRRQRPGHHPRQGGLRPRGAAGRRGRQGRRGPGHRGHQAPPDAHRGDRGGRAAARSWSGPGPGWWCCPPATSWPSRARRSSPAGSGTPTAS